MIGDLTRKADTIIYVSVGLKTVPWLAAEYGEARIKLVESLGTVSMGFFNQLRI